MELLYNKGAKYPPYQVKIILGVHKSRVLNFHTTEQQSIWFTKLEESCQQKNLLDFYTILEPLGKGGFGYVYKGIHKVSNEVVAVKMIKKEKMSEEDMDFHRKEIDVLKMCQHSSIIKLVDIFESAEYFFIVLECMDGGDLFDYLERRSHWLPEP